MGALESPYTVGIADQVVTPGRFHLYQNYPNPFNPVTRIRYDLPQVSDVKLILYDLLGREVIVLVKQQQEAGTYDIIWNGNNSLGKEVAAGMYFCRLNTNDYTQVRKLVLIK